MGAGPDGRLGVRQDPHQAAGCRRCVVAQRLERHVCVHRAVDTVRGCRPLLPDGSIPQDRGFKALFEQHPAEAIAFFAPDLIREGGQPLEIQVMIQHEVPLADLDQPSRFLDVALLARFADGSTVLLVEHWSRKRAVDYRRVALYVCSLCLRHPDAEVLPVVFVTDPEPGHLPERWSTRALGQDVLSLRVRVRQVSAASLSELEVLAPASRVAAALLALAYGPGVDSAVRASVAFFAAPGTIDEVRQMLPFIENLAKLTSADKIEFRQRLRQEPTMSIIEDWLAETKAEGRAEGKAEGKAEGIGRLLRGLITKGRIARDEARADIEQMVATGEISRAQGDAALSMLG